MVALDDNLAKCKLGLNGAKLRHYWRAKLNKCDCGNNERAYIKGRAICSMELRELLNELGYSVSKNYKK